MDIDPQSASGVIPRATTAGWTVLAIGAESDRERAASAIAAGADDWIQKSGSLDTLVESVQAAASGRRRMSADERADWIALHRTANDAVRAQVERLEQLSRREREVLRHLADGMRAGEISGRLFVSLATVGTHIRSIIVKLGVNSQEQAAEAYRETARRLSRTLSRRPQPNDRVDGR